MSTVGQATAHDLEARDRDERRRVARPRWLEHAELTQEAVVDVAGGDHEVDAQAPPSLPRRECLREAEQPASEPLPVPRIERAPGRVAMAAVSLQEVGAGL